MSWFWIIGIIANVALTAAAIVWVLRQGKPRGDPPPQDAARDAQSRSEPPAG